MKATIDYSGLGRLQRQVAALAESGRLDQALRTALWDTGKEGRRRTDRLIAPLLGRRVADVRNLLRIYLRQGKEKSLSKTSAEFGFKRTRGWNFNVYKLREVYKRGENGARKRAGLRVLGGVDRGDYPHAWIMPVGPGVVKEYQGGGHSDYVSLSTDSPRRMLQKAGAEDTLNDYVRQRLQQNIKRAVRSELRKMKNG